MTTAPQENRGGANGGAQYNPANVSGVGGNGQSGDYKGFAYGMNQQINQSRVEGNAAVKSVNATGGTTASAPQYDMTGMPQLTSLFDLESDPMKPISDGVDFGRGAGSEVNPKNLTNNTRIDENAKIALNYLPDLAVAASHPNAPDSFKRFVNYLVENGQMVNPNV
jgi:hypothetical protein